MSEELLRALQVGGIGGSLAYFVVLLLKLQRAITRRFDDHIASLRNDNHLLRNDNQLLAAAVERLETQLSTVRDARRADNFRCDQQIADLRRRIDELTN